MPITQARISALLTAHDTMLAEIQQHIIVLQTHAATDLEYGPLLNHLLLAIDALRATIDLPREAILYERWQLRTSAKANARRRRRRQQEESVNGSRVPLSAADIL